MSPRASPRARTAAPSRRWWRWTAPSCWRAAGASASRCAAAPPRPPCSPRAWRWGGGPGAAPAPGAGLSSPRGGRRAPAVHAAAGPVGVAGLDPKADGGIDNRALGRVDGVGGIGREGPWPAAAVAVDALLGTGAAGPARGDVLALAQRLVTYGAPIVAIDGPTGLDLSTGEAHGPLRADVSVTFGGPRRGHLLARDWCGKVVVVDIGFPPPDPGWPVLVTDAWAGARLPKLAPTMHKGDRGRVTVVGGSNEIGRAHV